MYIRNELTVQHSLDAMKRHTCARSEDRKFKKKQSFPHITLSVEWFIFEKKKEVISMHARWGHFVILNIHKIDNENL